MLLLHIFFNRRDILDIIGGPPSSPTPSALPSPWTIINPVIVYTGEIILLNIISNIKGTSRAIMQSIWDKDWTIRLYSTK